MNRKIILTLTLNDERGIFDESFIGMPRRFLNILKEEELLKSFPTPFPGTFNCKIIIDPNSETPEGTYMVDFYTEDFVKMQKNLEEKKFRKTPPNNGLLFSMILAKNNIHITEDTGKKIVLSF